MHSEMSKIVRITANVLYPFALTFGIYVIIHGHLTPGGGFQGGAIVASAFTMLIVAYGTKSLNFLLSKNTFSIIENFGAIAFICIAFLGIGATFFYNFLANSGTIFGNSLEFGPNFGDINTSGVLPLMNFAVGLKVLSGVAVILIVMLFADELNKGDENDSN